MMGFLRDTIEAPLRAALQSDVFKEAWANYRRVMVVTPEWPWEEQRVVCLTLLAAIFPEAVENLVLGSDRWFTIMLEEGLLQ